MGSGPERKPVTALEQARHLSEMFKNEPALLGDKEALLKRMYGKEEITEKERIEGEKELSDIYRNTIKVLEDHIAQNS